MTNRLTFLHFCSSVRREGALAICLALCTLVLGTSAGAQGPTFTTFDAPGAGTAAGQGTFGLGINPHGTIAGIYVDANYAYHGFLRVKSGSITTFDAPGAGAGPFQGTFAVGLNLSGSIAGYYADANNVNHGFLRTPDGNITTFDAPDAGAASGPGGVPIGDLNQGTFAVNIGPAGAIAGYYTDASNVVHGLLRTPDGTFTTFDVPGAGNGSFQGTQTAFFSGLNQAGGIAGYYTDASNVVHGLLRTADGTITTFDAPGAGTAPYQGTLCGNINPAAVITANCIDTNGLSHGFVRSADGTITTFDAPGAGTGSGQGTFPFSNNPAAGISGNYTDANGVNHGFLRTP